ncbi:aromatic-ring-hydroxylating dioxygenase subunit beta [Paraburkholderia susongensis]|uniref:3-phenylpropionate/cinnamic acid dioxygenase, small subunit n=1 Tax=Paraburkholderia susongensis TaxID=1515439 RepID=A0A1X7LSJ6_9BURK|nr:aromatic-ring-hydroxylating dioxygenase subunit beta [Paraburkholderia susongensis]SMG56232.1 3-phenylpropionate/cinnamic acid dioxygenase, small subunit [Paraburkholderia susongensis]
MTTLETTPTTHLLAAAAELIWREARLLDDKAYTEWLTLWGNEGFYTVPIDPKTTDFAATLNYIYDNAKMRRLRVERMSGGHSAAASVAARTVRTVSRFTLEAVEETVVTVRSAQVIVACKRGVNTVFATDLTHRLDLGAQPRILDKTARLVNSVDVLDAIGFLL